MEYYSINVEKIQAMKRYDDMSKNIFSTLVHYSLLALMLGLFLSSPLWIPTLYSSFKLFLLESLPRVASVVFGPKCLFVVFNLIIIFLVGESRLTSSSSKLDIYEEYVTYTQRAKGLPSGDQGKVKESVACIPLVEEKREEVVKEENVVLESPLVEEREEEEVVKEENVVLESPLVEERQEEEVREKEEEVKEEMVESVEEEEELADEELNRRVEAFIAKVNMQMRLEASMGINSCG